MVLVGQLDYDTLNISISVKRSAWLTCIMTHDKNTIVHVWSTFHDIVQARSCLETVLQLAALLMVGCRKTPYNSQATANYADN